jgi:hypothetical protein
LIEKVVGDFGENCFRAVFVKVQIVVGRGMTKGKGNVNGGYRLLRNLVMKKNEREKMVVFFCGVVDGTHNLAHTRQHSTTKLHCQPRAYSASCLFDNECMSD